MAKYEKLALSVSPTEKAQAAGEKMRNTHDFVPIDEADAIVVVGGDGYMLQTLHQMIDDGRILPAYGMNLGTVGFLMNKREASRSAILDRVNRARSFEVSPLAMTVETRSGEQITACAINEVSLLRETRQTAKLQIKVGDKIRIPELMCDGALVATPAGSTAYNFSANGPILPLGCGLLALTPISAFRPRRWRGAILPDHLPIEITILEWEKRPVSAVADQREIRDVAWLRVAVAHERDLTLLFDRGHSLDERIVGEQFAY
ncbi:NAD kinase [Croceicoccus ponticola]|uniref:NAD kinase n=1 Tax=Croceicoccus ponticola TaxID=2217664 RepID=A0A437H031_9SPHN|nr:NAD kinase [Croceicoccus ponticola]RVQ68987.1 NAD kinase [Croceicoccus ponticola]